MNLWRCFGGGDQQISLVAFAETVSDMKNQTSDSYSARKSTPDRACETFILIVWVIVIFGGRLVEHVCLLRLCLGEHLATQLPDSCCTFASRVLLGGDFRNAFGFCIGCTVEWM